jgi:hypothetical protein
VAGVCGPYVQSAGVMVRGCAWCVWVVGRGCASLESCGLQCFGDIMVNKRPWETGSSP